MHDRDICVACGVPIGFWKQPLRGPRPLNLHTMLRARQAAYRPVSVGLIGAGKFGTMFSAQIRLTDGMHLVGVADLDVSRARRQLQSAGWNPDAISAPSLESADTTGFLHVTDDA